MVHILLSVASRLSARQETQSPSFFENFDPLNISASGIHHFLFVLIATKVGLGWKSRVVRVRNANDIYTVVTVWQLYE